MKFLGYTCKFFCLPYKYKKGQAGSPYKAGAKHCNVCEIFMMVSNLRCMCCGALLSTTRNEKRRYRDRAYYNRQQRLLRKIQSAESFREWKKRVQEVDQGQEVEITN